MTKKIISMKAKASQTTVTLSWKKLTKKQGMVQQADR